MLMGTMQWLGQKLKDMNCPVSADRPEKKTLCATGLVSDKILVSMRLRKGYNPASCG